MDHTQILNILHNLSNLESSFLDYSIHAKDFSRFQTYFEYLNHYTIRKHELWKFYFPYPPGTQQPSKVNVREKDVLKADSSIQPEMDISAGKLFNFPDGPLHKCDYYTLIYVMEGSGKLTITDSVFQLSPGDFYLIPPMIDYALGIEQESVILFFNLKASFVRTEYNMIFMEDQRLISFITGTFEEDPSLTYLSIHSDNRQNIQFLAVQILQEYINQEKLCRTAMKYYLCLLFTEMYRQNASITSSQRVSRTVQHYQQIVDYLKRNYQTANLADTANAIHFSKQYICRIVKEASGMTFNTLLMKIRLDLVCSYLLQSNLSIEKITEICGFSTPSYLSRSFKQQFGVSPTEYKKEHLKD